MSLMARVLPPEEWPRLKGTEAERLWPLLNPACSRVLVVEDEGEIVATWTLMVVVHAECLWSHPRYRGARGVAKRLLGLMREVVYGWGSNNVMTAADRPEVADLIKRFGGVSVPGEMFVFPVDGLERMKDRAIGKSFHRKLAAQLIEELHPDDPEHNEHAGRALRMAIEGHEPERAMEEYNAFARTVGHGLVLYLGSRDGKLLADIGTAIIEVDERYGVTVIEQRPTLTATGTGG